MARLLEDGDISIDNNITERDIRPFTTERKS
ncbi:IS66 family transposase [Photobacterium leiognathi subsp. mandapamensis]